MVEKLDNRQYLLEVIKRETDLLLFENRFIPFSQNYFTNRERIAPFVARIITQFPQKDKLKILEIGAGQGKAINKLVDMLGVDSNISFFMTSITSLPQHSSLKDKRIKVYTGVLAERLPTIWTGKFDLVYTDSVLGWTQPELALPEIFRILRQGGIWFGFEAWDVRGISSSVSLCENIDHLLQTLNIPNQINEADFREIQKEHFWVYPYKCIKV